MTATTTEADQVAAVVAALSAANAFPHTLGDLARLSVLPDYYNEVTVSPVYVGSFDSAGGAVVDAWRITTRAVAKTEDNAREMRRRATAALKGNRLGGSTPVLFESGDPIAPDDGWFSGLTTWTFTA